MYHVVEELKKEKHILYMIHHIDVQPKMIGMEDHVILKAVVVVPMYHMAAGAAGEVAQHHVVEERKVDQGLIHIYQIIMDKIVEHSKNQVVKVVTLKDVVLVYGLAMVDGVAGEVAQHHVVEERKVDQGLIQIIQTIMDKIVEAGHNQKVKVVIHTLVSNVMYIVLVQIIVLLESQIVITVSQCMEYLHVMVLEQVRF